MSQELEGYCFGLHSQQQNLKVKKRWTSPDLRY